MSGHVWLTIVAAAVVLALSVATVWIWRVRRGGRPRTREEILRAAGKAASSIRRDSPRPNRDTFERGHGTSDRYGGALLENSAYGDAAGAGGGTV